MVHCPKCNSTNCKKDGIVKGKQRHKCKSCGYRHTVQYRGTSPDKKRQALQLYLEGLGFRSIGRILKCSHVAVYNWIKTFGKTVESLRSESQLDVVEMDEMHTYIGEKKTTVGYGLLLIAMGNDSSTACWADAIPKQADSFGTTSKTKI